MLEDVFNKPLNELKYLPNVGITDCKVNIYNEFVHDQAIVFFDILKKSGIEFYVFAGSAIGLLRNGKNIPWVDDYDIIIFEKDFASFTLKVLPVLELNSFIGFMHESNGCYYVLSSNFPKRGYFQCDIFISIEKGGVLHNIHGFGRYHTHVPIEWVSPPSFKEFDGMILPFFNEYEKDIEKEYKDVFNTSVIHIEHGQQVININKHWKDVYEEFYNIQNNAIEQTKKIIYTASHLKDSIKYTINKGHFLTTSETIDVLTFIHSHNICTLFVDDVNFLVHSCSIKYYFPNIKIIVFIYELDKKIISQLQYVDEIKVKTQELFDYYTNKDIIYINKPLIKKTVVITFGTFDVFHYGHTNLLKRCKEYGDVIVGVSTDECNASKNKTSVDSFEKRLDTIRQNVYVTDAFAEESLDKKQEYVQAYEADILIMGDDWKDKFDFVSCRTLYLERTPDISSTMIKELINIIL